MGQCPKGRFAYFDQYIFILYYPSYIEAGNRIFRIFLMGFYDLAKTACVSIHSDAVRLSYISNQVS